ncbi:ABC transporter ATP-binding protein, partial [Kitasatospora sp. NPDC048545]
LLFDEPLNGLDPEGVLWVRGLFRRLAAEGRTVFVSSHMMAEMEHTADRLVVIGRGRLIADESLAEFSARNAATSVTVRATELPLLAKALRAQGADVTEVEPQLGIVTGLSAERIGELARQHDVVLTELATRTSSLESAFMALTADSVEYPAGETR